MGNLLALAKPKEDKKEDEAPKANPLAALFGAMGKKNEEEKKDAPPMNPLLAKLMKNGNKNL